MMRYSPVKQQEEINETLKSESFTRKLSYDHLFF